MGLGSIRLNHYQQFILHTHTLLMVAYLVAFAVVFTKGLFDFGRFRLSMATFHGCFMELHCWLWRYR